MDGEGVKTDIDLLVLGVQPTEFTAFKTCTATLRWTHAHADITTPRGHVTRKGISTPIKIALLTKMSPSVQAQASTSPTTVVMSQDYNILSRMVLELAGIRSGWRYAFLLVLDLVGSDGA